jgi:tetratricopeptide (TPR) repeat protein
VSGPPAGGAEPYVGLRPYTGAEADRFFGRGPEAQEVRSRWLSQRLLILYGTSGVGKTSLLNAGVLPGIEADLADLLPVGRVAPAGGLPAATPAGHNPYTFALLSSWAPRTPPGQLAGVSAADFLGRQLVGTDQYGDRRTLLVAIDQVEELFGDPFREHHRDGLLADLVAALNRLPYLRLLLVIRADQLAELLPHVTELGGRSHVPCQLLPLEPAAALDAVRRPLEPTGRRYAPGVAEELVTELRTSELTNRVRETVRLVADRIEPVPLQLVCSELWHLLPPGVREITSGHRRALGDVDDILLDFCRDRVREVAATHGVGEPELCRWLRRAFITELQTRNTAYEGWSATAGMRNDVADALEERHILRSDRRSGSRWYELQHDRLIEPILRLSAPWGTADQDEVDPGDYLWSAERALAEGNLSLAAKYAEEVSRVAGGGDIRVQADAESFLGNLAAQQGDATAAERHYRRSSVLFETIQDHSAVGRLLAAIGRLLFGQRRYAEAVEEWQGAVTRLPGDLAVQIDLARALSYSGQPRAAIAVYSTVLAIAPEFAGALAGRGQLLADLTDPGPALTDLGRLLRFHTDWSDDPGVRSARAVALALRRRVDEARAELALAVRAAPDSPVVLCRAARVEAELGDAGAAADLARRALALADQPVPPHLVAAARRLLR